jgi:hypothetical protein
VKSILILSCMAATAAAQVRTVNPQEPPAPPKPSTSGMKNPGKDKATDVAVRGGTEIGWDDNILELNDKQISQLESGTRPDKFKIDDPGDVVYSAWMELRVKGKLLFRDATSAGLKVQPYFYQESTIANYEQYELFLKQDVGKQETGLELGLERDVYLRELEIVVPGPNLWESAHYDEWDLSAYYQHQVHERATLRGTVGWLIRDFEAPFGYRDRRGLYLALNPEVDLGRGWSAFVRYEYSDQEADAGAFDPDTSFREQEVEVGAALELLEKRLHLSLRYRLGFRDYTSSQDPVVDPSHVDREDRRQRVVVEAKLKVAKGWAVEARYEFRDVDSHRPFDDDATTSEPGDSTRNVVMLGVTFSL